MPRVTVGVPVYNGEPYLTDSLHSILDQDCSDIEVVISDNASTDATEEICRSLATQDERIRYLRRPVNRGAAWNYNAVLAEATAPFFKWAAADDLCAPEFLRRCLELLDDGGTYVVVAYPQTMLIDAAGQDIGPLDDADLAVSESQAGRRLDTLLRHRVEWHPVFGVMRTDVLRSTQGIGSFPGADIALLAEMSLRGTFRQVPARLFLRRYHEARSIAAGPSFVEQVAWYDPVRRARFAMPQTRLTRELVAGVARAPLSPREKASATSAVILRWTLPHWRHIGGEAKLAVRSLSRSAR